MAVVLGLVSCNKQELESTGRKISIVANTESGLDTKTSLSGNDASGYQVLWSEGDEIVIFDGHINREFVLTRGAGSTKAEFGSKEFGYLENGLYGAYYATDGSTLSNTSSYVAENVISSAPMYAEVSVKDREISQAEFKNLCGILRLTLKGRGTVKQIKVSADQYMAGEFEGYGYAIITKGSTKYVTQDCGNGVELSNEGTDFYIPLPQNDYTGVTIQITDMYGHKCTKTLKSGRTLNIVRALITPVSFSVTGLMGRPDTQDAVLPGVFSVSSSKKVHFSKGNLMAVKNSGSGYSWGFALNQYDYVGNRAGNTTIDHQVAGSVVDLFSWSTTSYYYGITTAAPYYAYPGEYREWGTVFDNKGTWFTLSQGEWSYLLGRAGKLGLATVCGVKGMLLLPDTFEDPMKNNGSEDFVPRSISSGWTANVYSGSDWSAMETAGAVFLPAAGWRNQSTVGNVGVYCYYWTTTKFGESLLSSYNVEYSVDVNRLNRSDRSYGDNVRLVTVVNQ